MTKGVSSLGHAGHLLSRRCFVTGALGACAALLSATALVGCGSRGGASGGEVTVADCVGRKVSLPANPERIAALDSFSGELLVMIGAGPSMCAAPAGVASDVLLRELYPGLAGVSAPMGNGSVNVEELVATRAQVALVKYDLYVSGEELEKIERAGIPYVVVNYTDMEGQISCMELIGQVCGGEAQERAQALAGFYRETIERCERLTAGVADADRVRVYHSISSVTMTDGSDSVGQDWIEAAGGANVSARDAGLAGQTDFTATLEQVYAWDPDVIVCNSADSVKYLMTKKSCAGLRAVRDERCYTIPVGATRWGQRGSVETYLAMLWFGATVYPKQFAEVDLQAEITAYYRDYLGLEIDDVTYKQILSGEGLRVTAGQNSGQK